MAGATLRACARRRQPGIVVPVAIHPPMQALANPRRATWFTAALTGLFFGALAAWVGLRWVAAREATYAARNLINGAVGVVFIVTTLVGVFGLAFFRDVRAEQRARGLGPLGNLTEPGDLQRFYLPLWGRMLAWFIAAGLSGSLTAAALR